MNDMMPFDAAAGPIASGVTLLEASAGTGKTWSLTTLATRLIVEGEVESIGRLLMVTFTRDATHELRERLRARLSEALAVLEDGAEPGHDSFLQQLQGASNPQAARRIRSALRDFDLVRISTIHGFCTRLLKESAFEAGVPFEQEDRAAASELRRTALQDAWREVVLAGPAWRSVVALERGFGFDQAAKDFDVLLRYVDVEVDPRATAIADVDAALHATSRGLSQADRQSLIEWIDTALAPAKGVFRSEAAQLRRDLPILREWLEAGAGSDDAIALRTLFGLVPSRHDEVFWKKWLKNCDPIDPLLTPLDEALAGAKASLRHAVLEVAHARLDRMKQRANLSDYDDLIAQVRARLRDPQRGPTLAAKVRRGIDVAMIDEFQDTDAAQWEIFETLFASTRLLLVGDPKQAIYAFRGADVFAYMRALERADFAATLQENHRSHPGLVRAVQHLFERRQNGFVLDEIAVQRVEPAKSAEQRAIEGSDAAALQFIWIGDLPRSSQEAYSRTVCARVVTEIESLLGAGLSIDGEPVHPGQIAVLTRTKVQAQAMLRVLRDAHIDAVIRDSGDIHHSEAMEELGLVLEAILDPARVGTMRRALLTRLWGANSDDLGRLDEDESTASELGEFFEELKKIWLGRGVLAALARVLRERDVECRWLGEDDGERKVTDLRHAIEWVHRAALERSLAPDAVVQLLWRERALQHGRDDETTQLRLERDEAAVQISTMHACKGLQYEIVFVPFAWMTSNSISPWIVHETGPSPRIILDWRSEAPAERMARAHAEALAEETRLLYVALTRARRRCFVVTTDFVSKKGAIDRPKISALNFLLHAKAREDGASMEEWVEREGARIMAGCANWRASLDALMKHEAIAWVETASTDGGGGVGDEGQRQLELRARALPSSVLPRLVPWSLSSFTSLTRGASVAPSHLADHADPVFEASRSDEPAPDGIFAFARGARAGVCLHEILERCDFTAEGNEHRPEIIREVLERHGLDTPEAHRTRIDPQKVALDLVARVADEAVPGQEFSFAQIDPQHRLDEWEFRAPVEILDSVALARVIADHVEGERGVVIANALGRLDSRSRRGMLGGFVDLVFEHDGRWMIIDWKSNHLGDDVSAYDPVSIEGAMLHHLYHVQMILYIAALHRYLRHRLPTYDYDTHMFGAGYVFLRGLCGREDRGWSTWKPPRALVDAVDALLAHAERGAPA